MLQSFSYYAVIEKYKGSYGAYFPDFPGSGSVGDSLDELRLNVKDCLLTFIEGYQEIGQDLPVPSSPDSFDLGENEKVELVAIKKRVPSKRGGARSGAGRPKTGRRANNTVSIYLTANESKTLDQLAKLNKTSKTGFLRSYILAEAARLNLAVC